MTSKKVLALHMVAVVLMVGCPLTSPFVAVTHPWFFKTVYFPIMETCLVLVALSWPFFRGTCFMTLWQNKDRRREGKKTYRKGCIDHYAQVWFGIAIPKGVTTTFLLACIAVPVVVRLLM